MSLKDSTILVIEDNDMNRKLCRAILESDQATVIEAETAEKGLELLEQRRPDLVLMDIQLPGMDGLQATRKIKENPDWRDIPVIALTAYAMSEDKIKVQKAGCDGYITKPYSISTLVDEVGRILLQYKRSDEGETDG